VKSVDALLHGLVDYAGLFPPASEDMRPALENYASYFDGPDRQALGRFIVPASRLAELEHAGSQLMPRGKRVVPWRLSVLVAEDVRAASEEIQRFNQRHSAGSKNGHAVVDVVEMKATTPDEIEHRRRDLAPSCTPYFEIPLTGAVIAMVGTLAKMRARAKMRTGGVTPGSFPPAQSIVDFMVACQRNGVPFKATAGLHHPVRGDYRLTYEADAGKGRMYGFLNVFFAAALLYSGDSEDIALAVLEETAPSAFLFEDDAIQWRDKRVTADQMAAARSGFAIAFGSCSFREPVDELAVLTTHARASQT
jgi:hypothetical protein